MASKVQMSISDAVLIAEKLQVDYFLQAALKTLIKSKKKPTLLPTVSSIKPGVHQHELSDTYCIPVCIRPIQV